MSSYSNADFIERMERHRAIKKKIRHDQKLVEAEKATEYEMYCLASSEDKLKKREARYNQKLTRWF